MLAVWGCNIENEKFAVNVIAELLINPNVEFDHNNRQAINRIDSGHITIDKFLF